MVSTSPVSTGVSRSTGIVRIVVAAAGCCAHGEGCGRGEGRHDAFGGCVSVFSLPVPFGSARSPTVSVRGATKTSRVTSAEHPTLLVQHGADARRVPASGQNIVANVPSRSRLASHLAAVSTCTASRTRWRSATTSSIDGQTSAMTTPPGHSRDRQPCRERPDWARWPSRAASRGHHGNTEQALAPTAPAPSSCHDEKGRRPATAVATRRCATRRPDRSPPAWSIRDGRSSRRRATPERGGEAGHPPVERRPRPRSGCSGSSARRRSGRQQIPRRRQGPPPATRVRGGPRWMAQREVDPDQRSPAIGLVDEVVQQHARGISSGARIHDRYP